MAIIPLIKMVIVLLGIAWTFWFLLTGLIKRDTPRLGKAVKVLVSVACLSLLLTIGEFVYAYSK